MFMKYLEGLKPLKITAEVENEQFQHMLQWDAKHNQIQESHSTLTDRREDYDDTNWVKEESGPFQKWQYCKNKIIISIMHCRSSLLKISS